MDVKAEVNGTPLPQRQPPQTNNQNPGGGNNQGPQQDKKPMMNKNQGNGGGGGGGPNMNMNRGGRGGHQNRGRGGGMGGGQRRDNQNRGGNMNRGNNEGNNERFGDRGDRGGDRNAKKSEDFIINSKLKQLVGPLNDLPPIDQQEIKFSGRNRLYVGNLTNDITDDELVELFRPYGEISEAFINKEKNFAFLKVDFHANAEKAKKELDGSTRKNRVLRVRFAPNATSVRVKNLTPFVTNELLYKAFEVFGQVESAICIVDDRGKPTGEGIVEYARKASATAAIRYCQEKCYFLTSSLRPCIVEPFDHIDDTDGYPEKSIIKKNDFFKARQNGPRFAEPDSFEHEYGQRWKHLSDMYKQKTEALKREMQLEEEKLEAQMEYAKYEHETEQLREQLRAREQDRDRQKMEWEMKERQAAEIRQRNDIQMKQDNDEMFKRMQKSEDELRRRQQENTLFMQAQQLNSMLDQAEKQQGNRMQNDNRRTYDMMNQGNGGGNNNFGQFEQNQRQSRFNDNNDGGNPQQQQQGNQGRGNRFGGGGNNRNNWMNNRGNGGNNDGNDGNDFQNKRRRF